MFLVIRAYKEACGGIPWYPDFLPVKTLTPDQLNGNEFQRFLEVIPQFYHWMGVVKVRIIASGTHMC